MRKCIYIYLVLILNSLPFVAYSQTDLYCGTEGDSTVLLKLVPGNGYRGFRKASVDTLRMLIVFVRFNDDNLDYDDWPVNSNPINFENYIESSSSNIDININNNISSYFKANSNDKFIVIGKALSIKLSKVRSGYGVGWGSQYINSSLEVADSIFNNTTIDLQSFDNWTYAIGNNHTKSSDGILDFVLLVHKDFPGAPAGFIENEGSNYLSFSKTSQNGMIINEESVAFVKHYFGSLDFAVMKTGVHELGHYLLSSNHPYNQYAASKNYHSIFGGAILHSQVNAYEKEELGWITVPEITESQIIELRDFTHTGDAVKKFTGMNGGDSTYTYFEYHKRTSVYDFVSENETDKGLVIYNMKESYNNSIDNLSIESSDGRWNWINHGIIQQHNDPSNKVPILEKKDENPFSGIGVRDVHNIYYDGYYKKYYLYYQAGLSNVPIFGTHNGIDYSCDLFAAGKYTSSSFNLNGNAYYSSITNPVPIKYDGTAHNISVRLIEETSDKLKFEIEFNPNPYLITKNTTFGGQVFLNQSLVIESGATVTFNKGTKIYLAENVQIVSKPGSKIIVKGTPDSVVSFSRLDSTKEWKGIWLQGNGSSINYAVFDGGRHSLMVQSVNHSIKNSVFRNGWRGIDSYANQSTLGTRSLITTLYNNKVENMSSAGIMIYNTNANEINQNTTYQTSSAGLYVYNGSVFAVYNNLFTNSTNGLMIFYGGTISTQEFNINNNFEQNGDGIRAIGSGYHWFGDEFFEGRNAFISNSNYDITAYSGASVAAKYNYFSPSAKIYGNVSYNPQLGYNPMNNAGSNLSKSDYKESLNQQKEQVLANLKMKVLSEDELSENALLQLSAFHRYAKKDYEELSLQAFHFLKMISKKEKSKFKQNLIDRAIILVLYIEQEEVLTEQTLLEIESANRVVVNEEIKQELLQLEVNTLVRLQKDEQALAILEKTDRLMLKESKDNFWLKDLKQVIKAQIETNEFIQKVSQQTETIDLGGDKREETISAQTYPNPFNPTAQLYLNLLEGNRVTVQVFDVLGRLVTTVFSGNLTKGEHRFKIDATHWATGLYLYRIQHGNSLKTGKFTVMK